MFSKRLVFSLGFALAVTFAASSSALAQDAVDLIDSCALTDHYWDPADYPEVDPIAPRFLKSLTLGGVGFTFDLTDVPAGSALRVNFNDQFEIETEVDAEGKAMVYFGLYSYGTYSYETNYSFPDETVIHPGPMGVIVVDAAEYLDCSLGSLMPSPILATETPETVPPTITSLPEPTVKVESTATPVALDNDETFSEPLAEEVLPNDLQLLDYITENGGLLCLCALFVLVVFFGLRVVIIRRRRRSND